MKIFFETGYNTWNDFRCDISGQDIKVRKKKTRK